MKAKGNELGIAFDFGGHVGNSLDSLRLLRWAQNEAGEETSEKLADEMARLHFEKKRCVADRETLLFAARTIDDLDMDDVKHVLTDISVCRASVLDDIDRLRCRGVSSIPFFELTASRAGNEVKRILIQGAASVDEFLTALRQILS